MTKISFFVSGDPKGQPRPRAFARRMGNKFVARVYDAGTAEGWKSLIAAEAKAHRPAAPLSGPLALSLLFHFKRPKTHLNKGGLKAAAPVYHAQKPDCDNAAKAVKDCLTLLGFWRDDAQVARLRVQKLWALSGGCQIEIGEA